MTIYDNEETVKALTEEVVSKGHRIFQIFKMGDDEKHVSELLSLCAFPEGFHILDMGCGIGEVARLMSLERPDLHFTLLNISKAQLDLCPSEFETVLGSMEDVPLSQKFDSVMFNYALGHGDIDKCFSEATRLLNPDGTVCIYDLEGDREVLDYKVRDFATVLGAGEKAGLQCLVAAHVPATRETFSNIMNDDDYEKAFGDVRPAFYRFAKC